MKYLIFPLLGFLFFSCGQPGMPQTFDYGSIQDNVYQNDYFNFSVDVPEGWVVQSNEEMQELSDLGTEMIAGDNEEMKRNLAAADINTAYLLTVFKYEVGALVDFNPSYLFVAENISQAPYVRDGSDYLEQSKQLLSQASVEYAFPPVDQPIVTLGGKEFHVMSTIMTYMGTDIYQTYYSRVDNGFALSGIISYGSDEQKAELEALLNTIQFN